MRLVCSSVCVDLPFLRTASGSGSGVQAFFSIRLFKTAVFLVNATTKRRIIMSASSRPASHAGESAICPYNEVNYSRREVTRKPHEVARSILAMSGKKKRRPKAGGRANDGNSVSDEELAI